MANVIVKTRSELIELWSKTYDYWIWSNAKTYVAIEYPLLSEHDRFIRTIPVSDFSWDIAFSFASAVHKEDGWRMLKILSQALREDCKHYQEWSDAFADDDLWIAFRWLHSTYRIRQAENNSIVFVWDAT